MEILLHDIFKAVEKITESQENLINAVDLLKEEAIELRAKIDILERGENQRNEND